MSHSNPRIFSRFHESHVARCNIFHRILDVEKRGIVRETRLVRSRSTHFSPQHRFHPMHALVQRHLSHDIDTPLIALASVDVTPRGHDASRLLHERGSPLTVLLFLSARWCRGDLIRCKSRFRYVELNEKRKCSTLVVIGLKSNKLFSQIRYKISVSLLVTVRLTDAMKNVEPLWYR